MNTGTPEHVDLLEAALWYVNHGIPVFPLHSPVPGGCSCRDPECDSPAKHPRTLHGLSDATIDPDQVRKWWTRWPDANIGILTGSKAQLLAVDVDPRNGGNESLEDLVAQHGRFPDTAEQISGGGGRHFIFRYPGGSVPKKLAPGIDLKGDGGYIVAAPSLHPSGRRYEWDGIAGEKALLDPAPAPEWLIKRIIRVESPTVPEESDTSYKFGEGQRNDGLTSLGGTMRSRGMSPATIEAALLVENVSRCIPPLSDAEVLRIARSVSRYPAASASAITTVENWPEPLPFPKLEVDQIPQQCLPGWLGEMAIAVAEATETPSDLSSLLSLGIVSSCVA